MASAAAASAAAPNTHKKAAQEGPRLHLSVVCATNLPYAEPEKFKPNVRLTLGDGKWQDKTKASEGVNPEWHQVSILS